MNNMSGRGGMWSPSGLPPSFASDAEGTPALREALREAERNDPVRRIQQLELALRRLLEASTSLQGISAPLREWANGVLEGRE